MSVINTNYLSLVAQNNLQKSQSALGTAIERLSSGLRINSAKDDAAGQAIANRMGGQIAGLNQAARNANDGISAAQTAEGALNQINDNLNRIRVLTVQAQNGTNSDKDLDSIQNEIGQRLSEINRISDETEFNGVRVLATGENLEIQVGANDQQKISISMVKINGVELGLDSFNVNGKGATANTAATADSLKLAGATQVGATNEYVKAEANSAVSSADLFANLKNGDVVKANTTPNTPATLGSAIALADAGETITDGTTTFTSVGDGTFTYSETIDTGDVATEVAADLTPALGESPIQASVKLVNAGGTQEVDILVNDQGKVTDLDGNALYWEPTTGNLSASDAGGLTQATAANIAGAMDDAANSGSTLAIGGVTYTTDGAGDVVVTGQTATAAAVASLVDAADQNNTFDIGGVSVDVNGTSGAVTLTVGGAAAYITAQNTVTADAAPVVTGFDSDFTYDASKNAFTYSTSTSYATGLPGTVDNDLAAALTPALASTTTATVTLGGKSTDVVISSDGNVTSKGSGQQLYIDGSGNLTETNNTGLEVQATATTLAALVAAPAANGTNSIAVSGGATYTYSDDGAGETTETVTGLTRTAAEVQDLLSQNAGGGFQYIANDFDGEGGDQTVNFTIDSSGKVAGAQFAGGVIASGNAYVGEDGKLTANATEDTSYWVQSNGNVTNDSGQRIYQDADGNFTTAESTAGGRTADALSVLDAAIAKVDGFRSDLGAIQNRFQSAIQNLTTTSTNLAAAQSRIQDADYAVEVANMTRAQILQQAGTSVLAQANQIPQGVLSLLR